MLRKEHNVAGNDELVKALQKIGKTCFAATSLEPCLPAIRKLVEEGVIKFKVWTESDRLDVRDTAY